MVLLGFYNVLNVEGATHFRSRYPNPLNPNFLFVFSLVTVVIVETAAFHLLDQTWVCWDFQF